MRQAAMVYNRFLRRPLRLNSHVFGTLHTKTLYQKNSGGLHQHQQQQPNTPDLRLLPRRFAQTRLVGPVEVGVGFRLASCRCVISDNLYRFADPKLDMRSGKCAADRQDIRSARCDFWVSAAEQYLELSLY